LFAAPGARRRRVFRVNGIDYPVRWIDRRTYAAIALKAVGSQFPQYATY
jgi:hypothetical protein